MENAVDEADTGVEKRSETPSQEHGKVEVAFREMGGSQEGHYVMFRPALDGDMKAIGPVDSLKEAIYHMLTALEACPAVQAELAQNSGLIGPAKDLTEKVIGMSNQLKLQTV